MSKSDKASRLNRPAARYAATTPSARRSSGWASTGSGAVAQVPDTPATRGMIAKVRHLVRVVDAKGERQ